jgi:hypothetical protein
MNASGATSSERIPTTRLSTPKAPDLLGVPRHEDLVDRHQAHPPVRRGERGFAEPDDG